MSATPSNPTQDIERKTVVFIALFILKEKGLRFVKGFNPRGACCTRIIGSEVPSLAGEIFDEKNPVHTQEAFKRMNEVIALETSEEFKMPEKNPSPFILAPNNFEKQGIKHEETYIFFLDFTTKEIASEVSEKMAKKFDSFSGEKGSKNEPKHSHLVILDEKDVFPKLKMTPEELFKLPKEARIVPHKTAHKVDPKNPLKRMKEIEGVERTNEEVSGMHFYSSLIKEGLTCSEDIRNFISNGKRFNTEEWKDSAPEESKSN